MLTSQQIINIACAKAKVPGMTQLAGQFLNAALVQVALDQNLDIIRRTTTISVLTGTPTYDLPTNYLRMREVFYSMNGAVFTPTPIDLSDYDALFKGPGEVDYPYYYATDIAQTPPQINFYPSPSIATDVTVRYMDNLVEITAPENSQTVPWFQDQRLLIDMVTQDLMDIADDTRATEFYQKNDDKMRRLIGMANDRGGRAIRIIKDPQTFRAVRNVKPTKLQGD